MHRTGTDIPRRASQVTLLLWTALALVASPKLLRAQTPHTFAAGEPISAGEMNENFDALDQRVTAIERQVTPEQLVAAILADEGLRAQLDAALFGAHLITGELVIPVTPGGASGAHTTVGAALDVIRSRRIGAAGRVVIEVASGEYREDTLVIDHLDGARIEIRGVVAAGEEPPKLVFADGPGLVLDGGQALGRIEGIDLQHGEGARNGSGIVVRNGSRLTIGPTPVRVYDFAVDGLEVANGSVVVADGAEQDGAGATPANARHALVVERCGRDGISATNGASVGADYVAVSYCDRRGIYANAAVVHAYRAFVTSIAGGAVQGQNGGYVYAAESWIRGADVGATAFYSGVVNVGKAVVEYSRVGYRAHSGGFVFAQWARSHRNRTSFDASAGGVLDATRGLSSDGASPSGFVPDGYQAMPFTHLDVLTQSYIRFEDGICEGAGTVGRVNSASLLQLTDAEGCAPAGESPPPDNWVLRVAAED